MARRLPLSSSISTFPVTHREKELSGDAAQPMLDLQQRWVAASVKADMRTLDTILVDSYADTDESGSRFDKAGVLAALSQAISSWLRAAFAAEAEGSPPTIATTRTGLPTKSSSRAGSRYDYWQPLLLRPSGNARPKNCRCARAPDQFTPSHSIAPPCGGTAARLDN